MKFIAGLRVWGNWEIGENVLKVFLRLRGSANRRVDLFLPLIASISGRRQGDASKCEMSRLGPVTPSAGREVIDSRACFLCLLAQAAVWLVELRVSRTFLDQLRPRFSGHGYPTQRAAKASSPRADVLRCWSQATGPCDGTTARRCLCVRNRVRHHGSTAPPPSVAPAKIHLGKIDQPRLLCATEQVALPRSLEPRRSAVLTSGLAAQGGGLGPFLAG